MKLDKNTKFILAIALQLVIIFALVITKLMIISGGREALLEILPVDPRDMLRGDYAMFQYTVSNIDSYVPREEGIKDGDTVYVVLSEGGKYRIATNVTTAKPAGDALFLKGKVVSGAEESKSQPQYEKDMMWQPPDVLPKMNILYGVEQYFIPEGTGASLNLWDQNREAFAQVVIDDGGNAVIKQLYVNDKPWP